jgi:Flp pilus assembly protein TadG
MTGSGRLIGDQRGGVIRAMFVRTILGMALLALAIFDAGQLVLAQIKAESVARAAATAAADTYFRTKRVDLATKDAQTAAEDVDGSAQVLSINIAKDGKVTVTVEKLAGTLVVKRVGFLKHFNSQEATDTEARLG